MPNPSVTPIEPAEIRGELEKVRASSPFVRSLQIQKLLDFLVETALAGRLLKETVIGVEVFQRPPGYDPKLDPVVRVEMRRLRSKLSEYYLEEGAADEVLIRLEKGDYVPLLIKRPQEPSGAIGSEAIAAGPEDLASPGVDKSETPEASQPGKLLRKGVILAGASAAALLTLVLLVVLVIGRPTTAPVPSRLFPLAGNAGLEMSPAFSPDGTQVAYSWDGNRRNFDIYTKPVEGGAPHRLTDNAAHDIHPTWSPDGRRIALLRLFPDRSELVIMPRVGGIETVVAQVSTPLNIWHPDEPESASAAGPVWSPDGSYLVIVSDAGRGAMGLVKIFLNGRQQVLTAPPLGATDNTPAISQSGGFTAFTRNWSTGSGDLFVVPSRGGTATRLTSEARDIVGLTWLDDDHLLYSSNRGGRFRLWQCKRWGAS